jgi:hypothetical protein
MSEQTKQMLLRIPVDVVEQLEAAALRFRHRSGNQVATDIVVRCLPIWEEAEQAKAARLEPRYTGEASLSVASQSPIAPRGRRTRKGRGKN